MDVSMHGTKAGPAITHAIYSGAGVRRASYDSLVGQWPSLKADSPAVSSYVAISLAVCILLRERG